MQSDQLNSILNNQEGFPDKYIQFLITGLNDKNIERKISEDFFKSYINGYNSLADDALKELEVLNEESPIDINSDEFKGNGALIVQVMDLIGTLSLAKSNELMTVLKRMGFNEKFMNYFVEIEELCVVVKKLMSELVDNEIVARIILLCSGTIVYYQINFQMSLDFDLVKEEHNKSKDVMKAKIEIENALRRKNTTDAAFLNSAPELKSQLEEQELRSILEDLKKGMSKNKKGGYNIRPVASIIYSICEQILSDSPTDHIRLIVFPLFEYVYPNYIDVAPDKDNPKLRDQEQESYYYTRDYRVGSVKSITGTSN